MDSTAKADTPSSPHDKPRIHLFSIQPRIPSQGLPDCMNTQTESISLVASPSFRSCTFHGIELFEESLEDWRARLAHRLRDGFRRPCTRIHTINPEILAQGIRDPSYMRILRSGTWCVVDGLWLAVTMAVRKGVFLQRRCGSDLIDHLVEDCHTTEQTFFLLGGSPESNTEACANLRRQYPGLRCVGYSPALSTSANLSDQPRIAELLALHRPAVLAVCLGAPKQETWMHANAALLEECGVKVAAGLGGTVDFLSGRIARAPIAIRRIGMEWLYRAVREPFRFRRYLRALPAMVSPEA